MGLILIAATVMLTIMIIIMIIVIIIIIIAMVIVISIDMTSRLVLVVVGLRNTGGAGHVFCETVNFLL